VEIGHQGFRGEARWKRWGSWHQQDCCG